MLRTIIWIVGGVGLAVALLFTLDSPSADRSPRRSEDPYDRQARKLESADVEAEVSTAIAMGDCRFVGVYGLGLSVPGVPDYHERYKATHGLRIIENTSDAIESDSHMRLQRAARAYAKRYNLALLQKLATP